MVLILGVGCGVSLYHTSLIWDGNISREVHSKVPYEDFEEFEFEKIIEPAPTREELFSIDESEDEIAFQRKYLAMESAKAMDAIKGLIENY